MDCHSMWFRKSSLCVGMAWNCLRLQKWCICADRLNFIVPACTRKNKRSIYLIFSSQFISEVMKSGLMYLGALFSGGLDKFFSPNFISRFLDIVSSLVFAYTEIGARPFVTISAYLIHCVAKASAFCVPNVSRWLITLVGWNRIGFWNWNYLKMKFRFLSIESKYQESTCCSAKANYQKTSEYFRIHFGWNTDDMKWSFVRQCLTLHIVHVYLLIEKFDKRNQIYSFRHRWMK